MVSSVFYLHTVCDKTIFGEVRFICNLVKINAF
jgi:hypothetical protein